MEVSVSNYFLEISDQQQYLQFHQNSLFFALIYICSYKWQDDVHEGVLKILRYWFNEMDPGCSKYFSLKNANSVAIFHETVYFDTFDNSTEQSRKAHEYYCDAIDYLKVMTSTYFPIFFLSVF